MPLLLALLLFRLLCSRCCHSIAASVLVAGCQIAHARDTRFLSVVDASGEPVMFGGVYPFSFFLFLAEVRFVCHFVLPGRADSMIASVHVAGCQDVVGPPAGGVGGEGGVMSHPCTMLF